MENSPASRSPSPNSLVYITSLDEVDRRNLERVNSPYPVTRFAHDFVTKIVNTAFLTEYWRKNHEKFPDRLKDMSCEKWVAMKLELDRKMDLLRLASEQLLNGKEQINNMEIGGRHPKGITLKPHYWLEVVHRRHYPGQQFHQKGPNGEPSLFEQWRNSATTESFFNWMPTARLAALPRVCYMEPVDRNKYALNIVDGKFVASDGSRYSTTGYSSLFSGYDHAIYVLGPDGVLYSANHSEGCLHHTSFFDGGMVIGAGDMVIKDGILRKISNCSGHYRPGKESMLDVLEFLRSKGVDLTNVRLELMVDSNVTRIYQAALKFLDCDGVCKPNGYKGASLSFTDNEKLHRVTFTDGHMTSVKKLAILKDIAQSGLDLTGIELVDGSAHYLSAARYLETSGNCRPCSSPVQLMVQACRTASAGGEYPRAVLSNRLKSASMDDFLPFLTPGNQQRERTR